MSSLIRVKRRGRNYTAPLPKDPGETTSVTLLRGLNDILSDACFVMGVSIEDVKSDWRDSTLVDTRALYAYTAQKMGYNLSAISRYVDKHHTTACHYIKKFKSYLEEDKPWFRPDMKQRVEKMMKKYAEI